MSVVGIDFGNDFSKVAVAAKAKVSMVPNDLAKLATPSLVGYGDQERRMGEQAASTWSRNVKNTVAQV